jgi:hypothetical protein
MRRVSRIPTLDRQVSDGPALQSQRSPIVLHDVYGREDRHTVPHVSGSHLERGARADPSPTIRVVTRRQEHVEWNRVERWIPVVGLTVCKGQFGALYESVNIVY